MASTAADVVDALSLNARELRQIGQAARRRVLAEHTADHRGQELIDLLESAA
jgi:spore maturation protein CgeB